MVRLLIEDVTVVKRDRITLYDRFRGGATHPAPLDAWHRRDDHLSLGAYRENL